MLEKEEPSLAMDPLRKLVSARLAAHSAGPHPDADALSAFAENVLPAGERSRVVAHLADCADCRQTLFLSLPQTPDLQKVVALKPSLGSRLAFRWGTLVAAVAVIAGVLTARHELFQQRSQLVKTAPLPMTAYYDAKISEKKVPQELDKLRDDQANKPEVATPPAIRVRPAEKHMTAKMQASLDFDKSGQVHLSEEPQAKTDAKAALTIQNLPAESRNASGLKDLSAAAAAPQPALVPNQSANEFGYINTVSGTVGGAAAKQSASNSSLDGQVQDSTGAAVANAKVTTFGPVGTRTVTSDPQGRFAFESLTPGEYLVRAEANGFRTTELKQIAVLNNRPSSVNVTLVVGGTAETVEVTAAGVPLDTESALSRVETAQTVRERKAKPDLARKKMAQAKSATAWDTGAGFGANARGFLPLLRWTLSPTGEVQSSDDGGRTWQTVSVEAGSTFRALSALGPQIWVGGAAGLLYHSADSGAHWARVSPAVNGQALQSDITSVDFSDYQHGTVGTSKGEVWSTLDGGASWQKK